MNSTEIELPSFNNITITIGVMEILEEREIEIGEFRQTIIDRYMKQEDVSNDGGNDKFFFSCNIYGYKLFVAQNEANGLTVMKPEEY